MRRRTVTILASVLYLACTFVTQPSHANPPPAPHFNIVHLGDSYSAGNGAGAYHSVPQCFRSANNWGRIASDHLTAAGVRNTYENRACSGAKIENIFSGNEAEEATSTLFRAPSFSDALQHLRDKDVCGTIVGQGGVRYIDYQLRVNDDPPGAPLYEYKYKIVLEPQANAVTSDTDLVLLTIGGNDINFGEIVSKCFGPSIFGINLRQNKELCADLILTAEANLKGVMDEVEKTIRSLLTERMAGNPTSQVALSSYPLLSTDVNLGLIRDSGEFFPAVQKIRQLGLTGREYQRALVARLNTEFPGRVRLIDTPPTDFAGHEPNPILGQPNPQRWINEILETEGDDDGSGRITSRRTFEERESFWHPNVKGHREWGGLVTSSTHTNAQPTDGSARAPFDVAIVLANSSALTANPATVAAVNDTVAAFAGHDTRFAIVTPQDAQRQAQSMGSYPSDATQGFTSDVDAVAHAVQQASLQATPAESKAVPGGIDAALNLPDWRSTASKAVIVVGDAPGSSDPVSGQAWEQLKKRAAEMNIGRISAIGPDTVASSPLADLVASTEGQIVTSDDSGLPEALKTEFSDLEDSPGAWLQGPFVAKVGDLVTFDARGSYATGGSEIVKYEFDLDSDGEFEVQQTTGLATRTYDHELWGFAGVRVTDAQGRSAIARSSLDITRDGDTVPDEFDNCVDVPNPVQFDDNGNEIGDACEDFDKFEVIPQDLVPPPSPSPTPTLPPTETPAPTPTPPPAPTSTATPAPSTTPTSSPTRSSSMAPTKLPSASPTSSQPGSPTASPDPSSSPSTAPIPDGYTADFAPQPHRLAQSIASTANNGTADELNGTDARA